MPKDYSIGYKFKGDASGFQRTMGEMNRSVGNIQKQFQTFSSLLRNTTAILGTVTLAIGTFKKIMMSSEETADKWNFVLSGSKTALNELGRSLAQLDFSGLIKGLKDAFTEGKKFAQLKDELEEATAFADVGIERLHGKSATALQNINSATSIEERKRFKEEYLAIEGEILEKTKNLADNTFKIKMQEWTSINHLDSKYAAESMELFSNYFLNKKGELDKYNRYLGTLAKGIEPLSKTGAIAATPFGKGINLQIAQRLYDYYNFSGVENAPQQLADIILAREKTLATANEQYAAALRKTKELFMGTDAIVRDVGISPVSISNLTMPTFGKSLPGLQSPQTIIDTTSRLTEQMDVVYQLQDAFANMFMSVQGGFRAMINSLIVDFQRYVAELLAKQAILFIIKLLMGGINPVSVAGLSMPSFGGVGGGLAPAPSFGMNVTISGRLKGQDIYLSGTRYVNRANNAT